MKGEAARRNIPICGPGAFTVLKSLAFAGRGEPKDSYDLIYVLRRWPKGVGDIANRLASHAREHRDIAEKGLRELANNFATPESIGPRRAASFEGIQGDDLAAAAADAHGYVDDLLRVCRERGLEVS